MTSDPDQHLEIQGLLPWYVSGALDEAELARVRGHLAFCPDCQAEWKAELRLAAEMPRAAPDEGDAEAGWRKMRFALAAPTPRAGLAERLRGWRDRLWPETVWLRWAVACQAVLLVAAGVTIWSQPARTYQALETAAPPEAVAGNVVVIFRPETSESELRGILRAGSARLVDGPTSADAYVLHVPADARAAALSALRARPEVVLAEPIDGAP